MTSSRFFRIALAAGQPFVVRNLHTGNDAARPMSLLMRVFSISPTPHRAAFGVNAAAFFAAAQFNGVLGKRFGLVPVVKGAVMGVVGRVTDGRPLPMVAGMAGGALVAMVLTWLTLSGPASHLKTAVR